MAIRPRYGSDPGPPPTQFANNDQILATHFFLRPPAPDYDGWAVTHLMKWGFSDFAYMTNCAQKKGKENSSLQTPLLFANSLILFKII